MSTVINKVRKVTRNKAFRYGLPFIGLIVIGSFGLSEFTSITVSKREEKNRMLTAEETLAYQKSVERVDVQEEYEKTKEKLDIEHWENKRGPRPWEQ